MAEYLEAHTPLYDIEVSTAGDGATMTIDYVGIGVADLDVCRCGCLGYVHEDVDEGINTGRCECGCPVFRALAQAQ